MTTRIERIPKFVTVRELAVIVAESADLTVANFPREGGFDPRAARNIAFYWTATGETPADVISFDILIYDGGLVTPKWVLGTSVTNLAPQTIATADVYQTSFATIKVAAKTTAATALVVRAARL